MKPKNTICLWFDKDAQDAARFYAATFPNSEVTAVHKAPGDYPSGKAGDVLTVEFTVLGIPCLGLNGGAGARSTLIDPALSLDSSKTFALTGLAGPLAGRNGFTFRIAVHSELLARADAPVVYRCGLVELALER